ncbi:MAG: hypothetical protein JWQ03_975 [Variovorax sp.]|nr:hypothetical protein [Variovorax sp.]
MKPFSLEPDMIAMIGGAFYPTGYSMILFPKQEDAHKVAEQLTAQGISGDDVYFIPSETILSQITPTVQDSDAPLPSAGTEAPTVRAYAKLAREGHVALLVKTEDDPVAEQLMQVVRTVPYSMAQRYRKLVIEDL